jgi:PadR family transcriptional regulator, regulatory protein PadR
MKDRVAYSMFKSKRSKGTNKENHSSDLPSLSRKEVLILEMLIGSAGDLFGLEMVEASKGELKRGTIYVTLQRMTEKGLIESKVEPRTAPEIGIPRRLYKVTGYGQRVFAAHKAAQSTWAADFVSVGG